MMNEMCEVWYDLMVTFGNSICEEYEKKINENFNNILKENPLVSEGILKNTLNNVKHDFLIANSNKKNTKKLQSKTLKKEPVVLSSNGKYATMSRKEIIEICHKHNIRKRRKTQDMIDELLKLH